MGAQKTSCGGKKISVKIIGKGSGNEKVTCEVGKIEVVKKGKTVEWSSFKHNLGNCSNVVFDVSKGKKPTVQVKTDKGLDYCPKSVQLEFQSTDSKKHVFCAKMSGYYKMFKNDGRNNEKIHQTTEGECACAEGYSGTQCETQDYSNQIKIRHGDNI